MAVIEIMNLTKQFNKSIVLDNISINFEAGKIYGLVGRNGSGKTMLLKCICGFVIPSIGTIRVHNKLLGKEIDIPDNIGTIIENPGFLPDYSAVKNLKMLAMIRNRIGIKEIKDAITMVGLDPDSKKKVGKYSLGMRQRLGLAQAVMEQPDILLLDEPMNGLDNEGVEDIRNVILSLKRQGKTIIIASHTKEDIEILCDEVIRMDHGKVIEHISTNRNTLESE
ncbi:ABC transporter ATP-binding protein [Konateibacter massiliensis]|uniref:ABC transporter ATP-binding protein n=1 Tax=Konateibacter massiliensis TaxID=2002841 RepID=UPI000C1500C0|nr:ATP-binding cassette domain-containing protein [Konateibacter massiliensis]